VSQKPAFVDDSEVEDAPTAEVEAPTVDQAEAVAESGEAESTTSEEE
jgi:hypothetical protein